MNYKNKIVVFISIIILLNILCGIECQEGEVELWDQCYDIETTTELNYSYITLGEISPNIGQLINLNYIHLSDCGINGEIPLELGNLENLISLQIYDNNHNLPDSLDMDSNLIGEIPSIIGNLINLQYLDLRNNQLTSSIPVELGNLDNLKSLLLNGNQLTDEIPNEIGNIKELETIDLSNNQLTGAIPESLFSLTNLTFLSLSNNQLIGNIPLIISDLSLLYYLDLSFNSLIGEIPNNIDDLSMLWSLSLANNELTGSIPPAIGNLTNLTRLWLYNNELTGSIPPAIGNLTNLYYIDLANNQLSGLIPNSICNLDWNYSSISNNQLCPPYPTCIENQVGYQNISGCGQSLPGNECETSEGSIGFYDCDLCCWDSYFLSWLGDNYCDQLGGCGWEGPQFNCIELGYDCGDCNSDWNGMNSSGLCVGIDFCDLNSDNMLNVIDVIIIINCILGLGDCDDCMDYNEDGEINILDIIRLVEYILE